MFPSETLMTAIQADRVRDLERHSRENRLLHPDAVEWTAAPSAGRPAVAATSGLSLRTSPRVPRTGRSSGSACEAV
jgi:hypothetical protein